MADELIESGRVVTPSLRHGGHGRTGSTLESLAEEAMSAQKKILLVDDSPTVLLMERLLLQDGPYALLSASSGQEAVDTALAERPDLILMDVVMPGVNGYQATRTLTRDPQTKSIPIVMITTKSQETDRIWGMRQGAVDYLVKPVSEAVLVAKANEVLERRIERPGA